MAENVKISNEEMDELLKWIKGGKTLKQIGRLINKKFKGQPIEDEEPKRPEQPEQPRPAPPKSEPINYKRLAEAIASKEPVVTVSVECSVGGNKKVVLGAAEPLNGRDLLTAHSDLYINLLTSLENIVAAST